MRSILPNRTDTKLNKIFRGLLCGEAPYCSVAMRLIALWRCALLLRGDAPYCSVAMRLMITFLIALAVMFVWEA
jgi:hypothetical protein